MVVDFGTLADTLRNGTRDKLIEQDIRENAATIAEQLNENGFYENALLGFKVAVNDNSSNEL